MAVRGGLRWQGELGWFLYNFWSSKALLMEKGGLLKRVKPAAEERGPLSLLEDTIVSF